VHLQYLAWAAFMVALPTLAAVVAEIFETEWRL